MKTIYLKKLLPISLFIVFTSLSAQVGVDTESPQQQLHVSGDVKIITIPGIEAKLVTPTVRIEGLNDANQGDISKLRPVSVTQDGDLVANALSITDVLENINSLSSISPADALPTIILNTTGGVSEGVLREYNFVIKRPSLVRFIAGTSVNIRTSTGGTITDNENYIYGTYFKFSSIPAGTNIPTLTKFGLVKNSYVYGSPISSQPYWMISSESIPLPIGEYTIQLYGTLYTKSNLNFRGEFGIATDDTFSIVAFPAETIN